MLTTGQAARFCSVTPDTILKWIKKGRLHGTRTAGGHYRIQREDLVPLVVSRPPDSLIPQVDPKDLRCWEYLGDRGTTRDDCRQCVVYRVRAARCFLMADMEPEVGHSRRFCQSTCEDCVYYRRVTGLATNVLMITPDDALIDRLAAEEDESVTLRFAHNGYGASAAIHDFRPAFAIVDVECLPAGNTALLDSLAADPRVPGLRIILVVPPGTASARRGRVKHKLIVGVLEKPFGTHKIVAVISRFPVDPLMLEESSL